MHESVQDYHNLLVWQRAHRLTIRVYRFTAGFPRDERFNLVPQMRRASASVATNIVEGSARPTPADFARFLSMAIASLVELSYQLELAVDLSIADPVEGSEIRTESLELRAMMVSLRDRVRATP